MIITIDGPTASGKSTIAQKVAQHNGMYYINSGYLYRAYAYVMTQEPTCDAECFLQHIVYEYVQEPRVYWRTNDITSYLKMPEIDTQASRLSALPEVRELITALQRKIADAFDIVIDGRDCGSVVFPDAKLKYYLTATVEVRAQRWLTMQKAMGNDFMLAEAIALISQRDERDMSRAVAPLIKPKDALLIDSTNLSIKQVCDKVQGDIDHLYRSF